MEQQQQQQIPSLASLNSLPVVATFAAFKEPVVGKAEDGSDSEPGVSFVRGYDPKVQGIEGFRHVVIRYRNTDPKKAEKPAQMVTIPQIKIGAEFAVFADGEPGESLGKILQNAIEDEQDAMIRSWIDQGQSNIYWPSLDLAEVIKAYNAVRVSQRLTKEQIEGWANVALAEACNARADQISVAKSYNDEQKQKQRAATLKAYVDLASKLAAPVPNIGQEQATALKNMLVVAKLSDDMSKVLANKLEAILNPKVAENGDL